MNTLIFFQYNGLIIFGLANLFGHVFTLRINHFWVGITFLLAALCGVGALFGLIYNAVANKNIDSIEVWICLCLILLAIFLAVVIAPFFHGAIVELVSDNSAGDG